MRWLLLSYLLTIALTCITVEANEGSVDTHEEQLHREKRVAIDDVDFDEPTPRKNQKSKGVNLKARNVAESFDLPVVLPPYIHKENVPVQGCMLYMENITVVVLDLKNLEAEHRAYSVVIGSSKGDQFGYDESYVVCPDIDNKKTDIQFTIDLTLSKEYVAKYSDDKEKFSVSGNLKFTLKMVEDFGLKFTDATMDAITIDVKDSSAIPTKLNPKGSIKSNTTTNIRAYFGYNFACDATQAIWWQGDDAGNFLVGIMLNNVQIQSIGVTTNGTEEGNKIPYFSRITADCQPTFSPGSWMGIIVTLVLVSVLMFGFLMLNSVQTMDRFDDPKQKQIVINFKE